MTRRILVVCGANLDLLGKREPEIYGRISLAQIRSALERRAADRKSELVWVSSNHEGDLLDAIGDAVGRVSGCLINPGAFTHTSIALRDALLALAVPTIEVHLSNIFAREEFRHHSMISGAVTSVICGLGAASFLVAWDALFDLLEETPFPGLIAEGSTKKHVPERQS